MDVTLPRDALEPLLWLAGKVDVALSQRRLRTLTIIEFLLARIVEDEELARFVRTDSSNRSAVHVLGHDRGRR